MSGIRPRVGLALGSGAARGWAHLGVIRELQELRITPDLVCGTSIGALVGAALASGDFDRLEHWVSGLKLTDVIGLMDLGLSNGMMKGRRLVEFLQRNFQDRPIEGMPMPFGAVATALRTGGEVWFREGSTIAAVRASIAMPGLLTPVTHEGQWLVDGALVNPVPVSLARAMGASIVIAVDLGTDLVGRHLPRPGGLAGSTTPRSAASPSGMRSPDPTIAASAAQANPSADPPLPVPEDSDDAGTIAQWGRRVQATLRGLVGNDRDKAQTAPSMMDVVTSSINVMQVRISRSRLAGEPPDVLIAPRLAHFGLFDFHRADEAFEAGRQAVRASLAQLEAQGLWS